MEFLFHLFFLLKKLNNNPPLESWRTTQQHIRTAQKKNCLKSFSSSTTWEGWRILFIGCFTFALNFFVQSSRCCQPTNRSRIWLRFFSVIFFRFMSVDIVVASCWGWNVGFCCIFTLEISSRDLKELVKDLMQFDEIMLGRRWWERRELSVCVGVNGRMWGRRKLNEQIFWVRGSLRIRWCVLCANFLGFREVYKYFSRLWKVLQEKEKKNRMKFNFYYSRQNVLMNNLLSHQ